MGVEIERKYLVHGNLWNRVNKGEGILYRQGYLVSDPAKTIRVRVSDHNAFITIKGATTGASRAEYEYEIPSQDANELLDSFSQSSIAKVRYRVPFQGKVWEVDEFLEENEGLILAEIELRSEDEVYALPEWVGKEVTGDKRYYNSMLSIHPYKSWRDGT